MIFIIIQLANILILKAIPLVLQNTLQNTHTSSSDGKI